MDPQLIVGLILFGVIVVIVALVIAPDASPKEDQRIVMTARLITYDKPVYAPATDLADDERRRFFLNVHGIYHKNNDGSSRQRIIRSCVRGEAIALIPEPDNPYDSDAVRVCRANGEQLGFLPEGHHMVRDGELDSDYRVTVEEVYAFEDKPGSVGCKLRIGVLKAPIAKG